MPWGSRPSLALAPTTSCVCGELYLTMPHQAGVCGVAALEEGRQFIGVEVAADRFRSSAELISAASGDGISAEETHRLRQVGRRRREREGKERLERSQKRYAGEKERRRADEEAACCGDSFRAGMRVAEAGRNR